MKLKESDILRQCRDYLRWAGWFVIRIQQGPLCHRGISDLVCVKDGDVLWVEIKTPNGKLSEYQEKFKKDIEGHGGKYFCIRSLDELKELYWVPRE